MSSTIWLSFACLRQVLLDSTAMSYRRKAFLKFRAPFSSGWHATFTRKAAHWATSEGGHTGAIDLLIDGDVFGPNHWPAIIEALRKRGRIDSATIFSAHGKGQNWDKIAKECGMLVERVPRDASGTKDPNDVAIAANAMGVSARRNSIVALAVQDVDFLYVATLIQSKGGQVTLVLPEGQYMKLGEAFLGVGAAVARYEMLEKRPRLPKYKAILDCSGDGQ